MTTKPHTFPVRVYFEDTDFSGVVYHASYLRFMERARTELLRACGIDQQAAFAAPPGERFGFAVRAMEIDFLKPAVMDDLLTVETTPLRVGGASLEMTQRILRGDETLVSARVRVACIIDGRAARLPEAVRQRLPNP